MFPFQDLINRASCYCICNYWQLVKFTSTISLVYRIHHTNFKMKLAELWQYLAKFFFIFRAQFNKQRTNWQVSTDNNKWHILNFYGFHSFTKFGMRNTFVRWFIIRLIIIWFTQNRRYTKTCMEYSNMALFALMLWVILASVWTTLLYHCFATLSLIWILAFPGYLVQLFLLCCIVLLPSAVCHELLSLSEILSESALMFSVGVTKSEYRICIMLVRCDALAPVTVSLRKSSLSTI